MKAERLRRPRVTKQTWAMLCPLTYVVEIDASSSEFLLPFPVDFQAETCT
jgi:hypothetical protein